MRLFILALAASSLGGCALIGFESPRGGGAEAAVAPERPAPTAVSYRRPDAPAARRPGAVGRPAGLVPCAAGARIDEACWRKGDRHYLFVEGMPDGLETAGRGPVVDVAADAD